MAKFKITRLSLSFVPKIASIVNEVLIDDFPEYEPRVSYIYRTSIFNRSFFRKLLKDTKNIAYGAFIDKELIGMIVLKSEFGGVVFIEWLAIKKEYRNLGIGNTLIKQAENWALKNKYHYLYLYTESDKNIKYYTKRGFEHTAEFKNSWFGATEHIMTKSLRAKPFEEMFDKYLKVKK